MDYMSSQIVDIKTKKYHKFSIPNLDIEELNIDIADLL